LKYVCNPISGRWIIITGPTYKKLIKKGLMKKDQPEKNPITQKNCKIAKSTEKICNPITGRYIKKQGLIYHRLLKAGIIDQNGQFLVGMIKKKSINSPLTESGQIDLASTLIVSQDIENKNFTFKTKTPIITKKPEIIGYPYNPDNFESMKKIGEGSYGIVYSAFDKKTQSTVVLKQIDRFSSEQEEVENEVKILKKLQSSCETYILCYIDFMEDDQNYYILTEFLGNYINLDQLIEKGLNLSDEDLHTLIENLKHGLQQIHSLGVAHRDIKPANIMVDLQTMKIKYIDFGVSCMICQSKTITGTLSYLAPELLSVDLLSGHLPKSAITLNLEKWKLADMWSLGMTILELILKKSLIDYYLEEIMKTSNDEHQAMVFIIEGLKKEGISDEILETIYKTLSPQLNNYFKKTISPLLRKNPTDREIIFQKTL
jgi:hypothetical protein